MGGLRKVGYSKERRVDPQVVIGLLVDRTGFPLEIGVYEGNKAEKATIVPIIKAFHSRHGIEDMVVAADAGMLSAGNLKELDDAGFHFIVGSRATKAPIDLESHFRWHGDAFTDGEIIDTVTPKTGKNRDNDPLMKAEPVWGRDDHPTSWRAVWAYSAKRFAHDNKVLNAQEAKARAVVAGEAAARKPRFVKVKGDSRALDEAALARARRVAGLKGYVTNLPPSVVPPAEVISHYHDLWHVEQSFRFTKHDLAARPLFVRTRDAIEAHVTVVFAALAVSRAAYARTGITPKQLVKRLRTLRSATIRLNGSIHTLEPEVDEDTQQLIAQATANPTGVRH